MTDAETPRTAPDRETQSDTGDGRMRELITEIARALVDAPEEVAVEAVAASESTALRLHVAPADVGKVIGKQGRTVRSMRTILGAVSMKSHHRYTLDIMEDERGPRPRVESATH